MIKHVVFDFDGTIANTSPLLPEIINEVLIMFNKPAISQEDFLRFNNMYWKDAVKEYGIKWRHLPKYALAAQSVMKNKLDDVTLFDHMKELIEQLAENYTTNIISLNSKDNIKYVIDKHNINAIENVFSTRGKVTKKKILKKYMKQFNIKKHELLYIGDELGDIQACKKHDIKVVAVTWGVDNREVLSSGNPDYIVDSPFDIAGIVSAY